MDEMGDKVATTSHRQQEEGEKRLAGRELGTQTRCAFDSSGGMHTDAQSQGNKAGYMAAAAAAATGGSMMMIIN